MGFSAFVGRVFFSALFILAAWQKMNEFSVDGGENMKALEPKLELFRTHVSSYLKFDFPYLELKRVFLAMAVIEGVGGILFTLGSRLGAYLLMLYLAAATPVMHDFYNYDPSSSHFEQEFILFLKNLSMFGALLFFVGMRSSTDKLAARKRKGMIKSKSL